MANLIPYSFTSSDLTTTGVTRQKRTYNAGWSAWSNDTSDSFKHGDSLVVNGMRTVGYKRLIREGKFVKSTGYGNLVERWRTYGGTYSYTTYKPPSYTTPAVQYRWIETSNGSVLYKRNVSGTAAITFKEPIKPDIADCGDEPNQLVLAALANIRSEQFDLSTQLAELKDLPRLFKGFASVLKDVYHAYKRGNISQKEFERLFDLPGYWLTFRYGIMPVVLSIQDVVRQLAQKEKFRLFADSATGNVTESYIEDELNEQTGSFSNFHRHSVEKTYSIRGCARLYYKDGRPGVVSDFLVTSWEVVPLSFVIDWVVNVGKVLASRAAVSGASDYDLSQNFLCTVTNRYESSSSHGGPEIIANVQNSWDVEYIYKLRQVQAYRPSVGVDFDMNWMRYADALSLSIKLILALKR